MALRLLARATQRMRSLEYFATLLSLHVRFARAGEHGGGGWGDWSPVARTDDTAELNRALGVMWDQMLACSPGTGMLQVGVRLEGLEPVGTQMPLFEGERNRRALMRAVDAINRRGGANTVYLGSMHGERKTAPRRIPFGAPPDASLPDSDGSGW